VNAKKLVEPSGSSKGKQYFYNITSGNDLLALFSSSGPMKIELAKVSSTGIHSYKPAVIYEMTGTNTVTGTRSGDIVSISMKYTDSANSGDFVVSEAEIKMDIVTGGEKAIRSDYWLASKISLSLTYTQKGGQAQKQEVDITPRQGYSSQPADLACTSPYSLCAPLPLSWSCTVQQLKKAKFSELTTGSDTVILHIPGMRLQPFKSGQANGKFGSNWDCEPLIPLSIWVSVLLTLGVAAIVLWALMMLSTVHSPSKFDDPKGPSIHIGQSE